MNDILLFGWSPIWIKVYCVLFHSMMVILEEINDAGQTTIEYRVMLNGWFTEQSRILSNYVFRSICFFSEFKSMETGKWKPFFAPKTKQDKSRVTYQTDESHIQLLIRIILWNQKAQRRTYSYAHDCGNKWIIPLQVVLIGNIEDSHIDSHRHIRPDELIVIRRRKNNEWVLQKSRINLQEKIASTPISLAVRLATEQCIHNTLAEPNLITFSFLFRSTKCNFNSDYFTINSD